MDTLGSLFEGAGMLGVLFVAAGAVAVYLGLVGVVAAAVRAPAALRLGGLAVAAGALAGGLAQGWGKQAIAQVPGATAQSLAQLVDDARRITDREELKEVCGKLEEGVRLRQTMPDPAIPPSFPAAARKCVEARLDRVLLGRHVYSIRSSLRDLAQSPLAVDDPDLRRLVASAQEELERISDAESASEIAPLPESRVGRGEITVAGHLAPDVVGRAVEQSFPALRTCRLDYESGQAGKVTIQLTIGRAGSVSKVWIPDPGALDPYRVSCVLRTFSAIQFPPPKGDAVEVTYTLLFAPGDEDEPVR